MAVSTERWLVEGAGARFLPGMDVPARDGDSFVFVDDTWPSAFQTRVGDSVFLRVSPTTGCYDFEDANGTVFWTVVPYAPLTWNWISPFRSPLHPDEQNLYSPFRLVREWRLSTPEIGLATNATFITDSGKAFVRAFTDFNRNGIYDAGEPFYCRRVDIGESPDHVEIQVGDFFPLTISKSSWDVDQDDILDSWEARNGLDATLFDDATSDQDNDGLTAVEEFWLGLDPSEPNPVTNSLWGVLSRSIDGRLEAGKSLAYFSNYLPNGRQGIFEINTNCWASDIDFSCLSPWNSRSEHNWNAGTLISPVHIIQADHFHSSIGRTLYFRGKSGVLYSRQLVALRTLPIVENYTNDVAIGLLDSPLPDDVSVAEFLPGDFTEFFGDGKGLPCVTFNQDREAIVGELTEIPGRIVINHYFVSCRVPFSSIRSPFYKDIRRFDSGSPRFLILGDKPILLCTMFWGGEGSGPSLTALKAEIQDAMDSLSSGYSLSIADFSPFQRTVTPPELDLPQ